MPKYNDSGICQEYKISLSHGMCGRSYVYLGDLEKKTYPNACIITPGSCPEVCRILVKTKRNQFNVHTNSYVRSGRGALN